MAKKNNTGKYMVIFMAVIMISSVFGVIFYGYDSQSTTIKYGDYKFTRTEQGWSMNTRAQQFFFDYLPQEVDFLNISDSVEQRLIDTLEIDITSEFNDTNTDVIAYSAYSMAQNLPQKYVRFGFTTNTSYALIRCDDATVAIPVIYFQSSNETSIIEEDNCVMAKSRDQFDFNRIKDRILYSILGVI
ncbi:MAG: hypothetical protein KJ601_02850 [Nanoarchaeota archaeon]|nr:hypothetical protein [Nanoarchaeota archaeon]